MEGNISRTNQIKVGAVLSYVSMGLGYIISIAYTPIMLRLLGQSEFGVYNLVVSLVSYLGLLNFGLGSAYMRYFSYYKAANDKEKIAKLNGMFIIVFAIIGLFSTFAGAVLVSNISIIFGAKLTITEINTSKVLMTIMVFNIALSLVTTVFNSYITANEEFVFQKLLQMIKIVVNPFVILPILLMGYKSIGMVVGTTVLNIIIEILNIVFCFKKLKMEFRFNQFEFSLMKEMTIFSSYIFLYMIIDQINWNVDKFLLGRFKGTIEVAIYGLASQLNTYYISLSTAISNVFIPTINRMVATTDNNHELTKLLSKVGRIQFMLLSLVCIGFIFFGKSFIYIWVGPDYSKSYSIMLLLIIPVTIPLIQNLGIEIQKAKNIHQFRSWTYLFIAIINILISIPLSKLYGGIGSALGTAISLLIGNGLLMNWYYHKKVGLNMKFFWIQVMSLVPSLLIPISFGIITIMFVNVYNVINFLIYGIAYVIVFCFSIWILGMNIHEKDLIRKPVIKVVKKIRSFEL